MTQKCVIGKIRLFHPDGSDVGPRPPESRLFRPTDSFEDLHAITMSLQVGVPGNGDSSPFTRRSYKCVITLAIYDDSVIMLSNRCPHECYDACVVVINLLFHSRGLILTEQH